MKIASQNGARSKIAVVELSKALTEVTNRVQENYKMQSTEPNPIPDTQSLFKRNWWIGRTENLHGEVYRCIYCLQNGERYVHTFPWGKYSPQNAQELGRSLFGEP